MNEKEKEAALGGGGEDQEVVKALIEAITIVHTLRFIKHMHRFYGSGRHMSNAQVSHYASIVGHVWHHVWNA